MQQWFAPEAVVSEAVEFIVSEQMQNPFPSTYYSLSPLSYGSRLRRFDYLADYIAGYLDFL